MKKSNDLYFTTVFDITAPVISYLFMTAESFPKQFGYGVLILMIIAYYLESKIRRFKIIYFWSKLVLLLAFLGIVWMVSYSFPAYGGLYIGGYMGAFAAQINAKYFKTEP